MNSGDKTFAIAITAMFVGLCGCLVVGMWALFAAALAIAAIANAPRETP